MNNLKRGPMHGDHSSAVPVEPSPPPGSQVPPAGMMQGKMSPEEMMKTKMAIALLRGGGHGGHR